MKDDRNGKVQATRLQFIRQAKMDGSAPASPLTLARLRPLSIRCEGLRFFQRSPKYVYGFA